MGTNFAHRLPWGHAFANENIQVQGRAASVVPEISQPVSRRVSCELGAAPSPGSAQEVALPALLLHLALPAQTQFLF